MTDLLQEFANACRRLHDADPAPGLLGCAHEAEWMVASGWDDARLQQLVAGVPQLGTAEPALVREVLGLAVRLRLSAG